MFPSFYKDRLLNSTQLVSSCFFNNATIIIDNLSYCCRVCCDCTCYDKRIKLGFVRLNSDFFQHQFRFIQSTCSFTTALNIFKMFRNYFRVRNHEFYRCVIIRNDDGIIITFLPEDKSSTLP